MNSAALFPLSIFLIFPGGQLWFYLALVLIGGLSTFYLCQMLRLHSWICLAAGLAFGLNGTAAWFRYSAANPVCFLPLLLVGIELVRQGLPERKTKGWLLISGAIALSIYAGFPETAFLDGLVGIVWVIGRSPGLDRSLRRRFLGRLSAGAGLGVLLGAPLLLAFLEYFPNTYIGAHSGAYSHASLTRDGLTGLLFPYFFGPIFGFDGYPGGVGLTAFWGNVGGYLTTSLLFLALIGLFGSTFRLLRLCLAIWGFLIVGKMFGIQPVSNLLNLIPGVHYIAFYRYATPGLEMIVTILAVLGVHDLTQHARQRIKALIALVGSTLVAFLVIRKGLPLDRSLLGAPHHRLWFAASLLWGLGLLVFLFVVSFFKVAAHRRLIVVVILGLDCAAMFTVPEFSAPRSATLDMAAVDYLQRNLGTYRFYTLGPLAPDYGSYFGLASLATNDLPDAKLWNEIVVTKLDPNSNAGLFTGGYSIDPAGITPLQAFIRYYKNYEALGDKYLLEQVTQPSPMLAGGPQVRLVYRDAALKILALPDPAPYFSAEREGCTVVSSSRTDVSVSCSGYASLLRNELYMPGWSVTNNGNKTAVRRSGDNLQRVSLSPGVNSLHYAFAPPHSGWAFGGLILALGIASRAFFTSRKRTNRSAHRRAL